MTSEAPPLALAPVAALRRDLPGLAQAAAAVAAGEAQRDPRLREVDAVARALAWVLLVHVEARGRGEAAEGERDVGLRLLRRLAALTDGFRAPPWAGPRHRDLLDRMARLEHDVRALEGGVGPSAAA